MGVEEPYWGILDELFLQDSPHMLKPGNSMKRGNFEVEMREKSYLIHRPFGYIIFELQSQSNCLLTVLDEFSMK